MSKTIANLRVGVRTFLDEAQQTDFLDTEVDSAINYAYHKVAMEAMKIYEEFYSVTTPYTYAVVANQQEYTISSSLIKVTRVEINYKPTDTNSKPMRALPVKKDEVLTNLAFNNSMGSFFNAGYYLHGNMGSQKIGFVPIPTVADTTGQSISVWGIALPTDLSDSNTDVNIPWADNFSELIELRATARLLSKGQQAEEESNKYYQLYEKGAKDMREFLKERQADGVWMVEDSTAESIDFGSLSFS